MYCQIRWIMFASLISLNGIPYEINRALQTNSMYFLFKSISFLVQFDRFPWFCLIKSNAFLLKSLSLCSQFNRFCYSGCPFKTDELRHQNWSWISVMKFLHVFLNSMNDLDKLNGCRDQIYEFPCSIPCDYWKIHKFSCQMRWVPLGFLDKKT